MEERRMAQAKPCGKLRPRGKSLPQALWEFLTPQVFKQVRKSFTRRKQRKWDIHPLVYILLMMSWCCGESLPEQFETARGFYVVCCAKRKRPGKTCSGFERAVSRLPMPVLRALAAALRERMVALFGERLFYKGFIPLGCDGTRQEVPRTEELEQRLGTFGKEGSAPMIWNTSIVHLLLGVPFCWRFGLGGKASERHHLLQMLSLLPKMALIVADAGYVGFDLVRRLIEKNVFFLIRMSSSATFYTEDMKRLETFEDGLVYYWPKSAQQANKAPIFARLMRVRSRDAKDVWLLTNVHDSAKLPLALAALFYRWRWENEGFFRTYKRTLKKVKLMSRTVRMVHREAEASMIATQLLLCQGALSMPAPKPDEVPLMCSPRGVLLEIRRDIRDLTFPHDFTHRLTKAQRERRPRKTAKQKREWPRRKTHTPPKPPKLLRLTDALKSQIQKYIQAI
jgi:hypothetical protein